MELQNIELQVIPSDKINSESPSPNIFGMTIDTLHHLIEHRSIKPLKDIGGIEGLSVKLGVDLHSGISMDADTKSRIKEFGENRLPAARVRSLLELMFDAMHDPTLIVLSIAAAVSLGIGLYEDYGLSKDSGPKVKWVEGVAIIIAVVIVVLVGSINDYQKEQKFRELNGKKEDRELKLIRDGKQVLVSVYNVMVGDIVCIEPGDVVAVDGVLFEGHNVKCDESSVTGESDLLKKTPYSDTLEKADCFLISGSKVSEGVGKFIVTAVGVNSFHGRIMIALRVEQEETPLQKKLGELAESIAKVGALIAVLLLIILLCKYLIVNGINNSWESGAAIFASIVNIVIQSIIIVVVAVPEGLPLAVTLALAYATSRMLKDNNLVRVLASCETMGGATTICSDKTGTLTQNRMTVVQGLIGHTFNFKDNDGIIKLKNLLLLNSKDSPVTSSNEIITTKEAYEIITSGIIVNSTAFEQVSSTGSITLIGSKTETALLEWVKKLGIDNFQHIRDDMQASVVQVYPFSSERKSMAIVLKIYNSSKEPIYRVYIKGASEIILAYCNHVLVADEELKSFKKTPLSVELREIYNEAITKMASGALRTICFAYCDLTQSEFDLASSKSNENSSLNSDPSIKEDSWILLEKYFQTQFTLLGLVGIEDPIREGVQDAVAKCQQAGIFIRMVTGDNVITAKAIAEKCGIFMKGGIVMEGKTFRKLNQTKMDSILPRLQVLARSSPLDKQILVERLKVLGETVAVTGDGTNDGPALKMADIGFSMGITGTEVAKEASSIILMDDNFASILQALLWGRCVNDSVRKFLQFQLTVNVSAVLIAFITAISTADGKSILTAVQLLWINLIMDTLAALALATDVPTLELLDRSPETKRSPLINVQMWKMIIGQAMYQVIAILICFYLGHEILGLPKDISSNAEIEDQVGTFVFNTFVWLQIFNQLNCRRVDSHLNIFSNIMANKFYLIITTFIVIGQIILVEFGGAAFQTIPVNLHSWLISIIVGFFSLPLGVLIRLTPSWDGCVLCGVSIAVPDTSRIFMTKERLHWFYTVGQIRTQLSVFRALRGSRSNISTPSSVARSEKKNLPHLGE